MMLTVASSFDSRRT